MKALTPPTKWHGGKHDLAKRIRALFPPSFTHYVEPFFGGGAVLLADPKGGEGVSEVVNDLNSDLMTFWRVLQHHDLFPRFVRRCEATPFSEDEWRRACEVENAEDPVASAWCFFVNCRQSLAGRMNSFAPLSRNRTRKKMNEQASAWLGAVEGLPAVHARLKRVVIVGPKDAKEVIRQQDGENTFFYCDPPYLKETRTAPEVYQHEMAEAQHTELLEVLAGIKGKFLLSGYHSDLYGKAAVRYGWDSHEIEISNHASGGESKRRMTEVLWSNYPLPEQSA